MKFRTMLLASAAVMFTSSAFAADITNPFFLPTQGKFLSDTSVEYSRAKMDLGAQLGEVVGKDIYANETLTFGLTDNLAIVGSIGNTFDYDKDDELNNDHNFDYMLGVKYNHNFGKVLTQVGVSYWTMDPRSWYGTSGEGDEYDTNRWEKELGGYVQVGYDMGCFTPYTYFSIDSNIDKSNREQNYTWFIGAHKMFDKVALDAGFRYAFGDEDMGNGQGDAHEEAWFVEASADYYVKDNFTLGLYGDYYLGGTGHEDVEYDYTIGLNAKVLF